MDEVKLNLQELLFIEELHKSIVDKWQFENDLKMLLWDGVQSLKNNLFFSSISVFTVFLEKYLRDTLIWCEFLETKWAITEELFFQHLEAIEEKLEDGKNEEKNKYMFPIICDKLVKYWKIEEPISLQLKEIYEKIRIPVQHWIYGRIVRENIWRYTIPVNKITLPENLTPENLMALLEGPMNDTMNIQNPMFRMLIIPEFFKYTSLNLLKDISTLVELIESKKENTIQ